VREELRALNTEFDKTESDLRAIQNVGQIIGEVLKQLTEDKCALILIPPAVDVSLIS
jgi:hypothetical protein